MIKINKPSKVFKAKALYRYRGTNTRHFQERRFQDISIIEIDHNLREELLIKQTMFDGTKVMFSMISANIYIEEDGVYRLKEDDNFCDFELHYDENYMIFEGGISYLNSVNLNLDYKEYFDTTLIAAFNKSILDIWVKHNKIII